LGLQVTKQLALPHRSGTPLAGREGVQLRLAEMHVDFSAARALLCQTAALAEARGRDAVADETIATKIFCTEMVGRVVDSAVSAPPPLGHTYTDDSCGGGVEGLLGNDMCLLI